MRLENLALYGTFCQEDAPCPNGSIGCICRLIPEGKDGITGDIRVILAGKDGKLGRILSQVAGRTKAITARHKQPAFKLQKEGSSNT